MLPIVALDDAVGLMVFAVSFGVAKSISTGAIDILSVIVEPVLEVVLSIVLGAVMGGIFTFCEKFFHSNTKRQALVVTAIFLAVALSKLKYNIGGVHVGFSPLLVCMMLGTIFCNVCDFSAELMDRLDRWTAPIFILFFVFIAGIALLQAVRKVPVQYAKRVIGNKQYGGVRQYIPLKLNAAGVMPIIFAQALMLFPLIFSQFDATRGFAATMSNYTGFWYNITFFILVVLFTYFYTAVTVNPTMMAEEMRKNGGFVPGVKPGKKTAEYIDTIMSRVTLPGAIFLGFIAILPAFAMLCGVNNQFASFYGGTSLLILVGVVLDTLQQIESHLLMRHYDGLMKTGRLKGRSGM